jgi:hypothetical protein
MRSVPRAALGVVLLALAVGGCGGRAATSRAPAPTAGKAGAGVAIGATVEQEGTADPAEVARAAVEEVVSRYGGPEWCYDDALRTIEIAGKLTFAWDITAEGEATRVRVVSSTLRPVVKGVAPVATTLPACVATQISRWRFPPQVRGRSVTYTFTFRRWWGEPTSRPARTTASEQVADLPERDWHYRIGSERPPREPRIGSPPRGAEVAPGSMPAPPASHPVRGTVAWAGPVIRPRSCVDAYAVRQRLVEVVAPIQRCYDRERRQHPRLEGRLLLRIAIAADGTTSAGVERSTVGADATGLLGCVTAVVRGLRFTPRKGCEGTTVATFPLLFSPP